MQPIRRINDNEIALLKYLIKKASIPISFERLEFLLVQQMEDGGMGSFLIFDDITGSFEKRKFGKQVSEFEFVDDDGIVVLVSLNIDDQSKLFEVDVWKADYNPVLNFKIPRLN